VALITEDGTGKADAESYISVADAMTYHAARGNAAWAALSSDAVREQLLRKAAEYMQATYRTRWAGYRKTVTQALDWPRYEVPVFDAPGGYGVLPAYVNSTIIPVEVQRACAELALKASSADLLADQSQGVKSKTVGSIAIVYDERSNRSKQYVAIDRMLRPYLSGSDSMLKVVRS
jgi:hypothetical protein